MYLLKRAIEWQVSDLQRMLGMKEVRVNERDDNQMEPLHYAAWYNKHEAVEMLIKHGAGRCGVNRSVVSSYVTSVSCCVRSLMENMLLSLNETHIKAQ